MEDALYCQTMGLEIYTIKVGTEVVGKSAPGDIFFSDFHIENSDDYAVALQAINACTGRCWLLTDDDNPTNDELAQEADFEFLGTGVWFRGEIVVAYG